MIKPSNLSLDLLVVDAIIICNVRSGYAAIGIWAFGCTTTDRAGEKAIYHDTGSDNVTITCKRSGTVICPSWIVIKFTKVETKT